MTMLETMPPQPERDRWGRPLVVPPEGGKKVAYTRCTTFVGCIEDTYNLSKWQQRMVALGLASRPDLLLSVSAHRDDKRALDKVCEDAQEAAKAHAAATTGTALHALTERMDRGMEVGVVPEEYMADLAAYATATEALTATHIEQFTVLDQLRIGGTPDRVVRYNGKRYIADLKTGSIDYGYLKIAAQLAVYARSRPYDVSTDERLEPHGAEVDKGIIIHLPAGTGTCRLYWVDLLEGWNAVRVARDVREKRSLAYRDLVQPFDAAPQGSTISPPGSGTAGLLADVANAHGLINLIRACATEDEVRALWGQHAAEWTQDHTELAKQHIAALAAE